MTMRKILAIVGVLAVATLLSVPTTFAGDYPDRSITLIVPYSPGGGSDLTSKVVAENVSKYLGKPVVSVYKPGSGGAIGAAYVAKSKPDGYTMLVGSQTPLVVSPLVKKQLGYTQEDLIPIVGYSKIPISINVRADSKWKSIQDFVADAKKNPGKYKYSSYGTFGASHLAMELFAQIAGIKLIHVPFAGSAKANAALLGGHVDLSSTTGTGGLYEAGKLRTLVIADEKRSPLLPEVPTLKELGYPVVLDIQYAYCVPKGTPDSVIKKLVAAHEQAFEENGKAMAETFAKVEQIPSYVPHEQIIAKYNQDKIKIKALLKTMGVKTE
jgi:tripartite-type tricarboxylate transporter receptor subunit TctC